MSGWKKYKLLAEDEYERLKIKELRDYNPQLKSMVRAQMDIDNVLSNKGITPDEKIKLIQTIRYTSPKMEESAPPAPLAPPVQLPSEPAPAEVATQQVEEAHPNAEEFLSSEDISEFVPDRFKARARLLSKHLSHHPDIVSIDDNLQLVINGKPIIGSNFVDLLHSLYVPRKNFRPPGQTDFIQVLRSLNVPSTYISNRSVSHALSSKSSSLYPIKHKPKFSPKSKAKRTSILRMYKTDN